MKQEEERGSGLAAKLRVTQEATAVSAPPYACDCRVTCSYVIKEFIFSLLRVSETLQKWDESMRYQAQRSANEHGARYRAEVGPGGPSDLCNSGVRLSALSRDSSCRDLSEKVQPTKCQISTFPLGPVAKRMKGKVQ